MCNTPKKWKTRLKIDYTAKKWTTQVEKNEKLLCKNANLFKNFKTAVWISTNKAKCFSITRPFNTTNNIVEGGYNE